MGFVFIVGGVRRFRRGWGWLGKYFVKYVRKDVTLDLATIDFFKKVGYGNMSEGMRKIAHQYTNFDSKRGRPKKNELDEVMKNYVYE